MAQHLLMTLDISSLSAEDEEMEISVRPVSQSCEGMVTTGYCVVSEMLVCVKCSNNQYISDASVMRKKNASTVTNHH